MLDKLYDLALILLALVASTGWLWTAYRAKKGEARRQGGDDGAERADRYQAMVEDQGDLICRADARGKLTFVNGAFCRFFGCSREEMIGAPVGGILADADAEGFRRRIAALRPDRPTVEVEHAAVRHDGGERWLHWTQTGLFGRDGGLLELHAVGRDITARKQAEDALQESEKRLRLFTDAMPALFSYVDRDRRYRFCNLQFEKHFHRKRNDILGSTVAELLGAEAYAQMRPLFDRALAGETLFYEQWVDYREAGRRFMRGSMVPDVADAGRVEGLFAMAQDMTAKKKAEDALAWEKEQAEALSASKSRFLAAASHDLRQPLQALAMFVEVLAGRPHDTQSRDIIDKIQASSRSLESLLNSLLDMSRLEADLVKPAVRRFVVGELTGRLAEEIRPLAEAKGLSLVHVASLATVTSDPGLLDRVLRNLLVNAVANTDRGRILFGCRRRGGTLAIEVWDTGVGIADDQKSLIFQEFYQGGGSRPGGLGLGLAIVDRLGRLLGHRIEVDSTPGKGSVFRIGVPLARAASVDRDARAPAVADAGQPGALIVGIDDDPAVRDALSMLLESWGFETVIAGSEREVVNRLSADNRTPDLVIADFELSHGDRGSHAIDAIRRRWGRRIPGLVLTGETDPARLREATASGLPVVKKPIRPETLKAVVAEQIETGAPEPARPGATKGRRRRAAADT